MGFRKFFVMSKVKVKGTFGGKTRFAEVERTNLTVQGLEEAFKKVFSLSSVQMKYKMSNGNIQGVYQDFHLEKAMEDSVASGAKYLQLEITGAGGAPASSAPAPTPTPAVSTPSPAASIPKPAAISPAAAPAPSTGYSPSPTNRKLEEAFGAAPDASPSAGGRFCTKCGAAVSGAKFCPECGAPQGGAAQPKSALSPGAPKPASSTPVSAPKPSNGCAACGGNIGLTSVAAMNLNWHKECFVCQNCRKSLLECGFKNVNNLPMCGDCYNDRFGLKCSACNKVIDSEYVQVAGKPFHRECYG